MLISENRRRQKHFNFLMEVTLTQQKHLINNKICVRIGLLQLRCI